MQCAREVLRFEDDAIDESETLRHTLEASASEHVEIARLPGTHLTPLTPEEVRDCSASVSYEAGSGSRRITFCSEGLKQCRLCSRPFLIVHVACDVRLELGPG